MDIEKYKRLLMPDEDRLLLFINLLFASLFVNIVVRHKLLFLSTFYPTLYIFTCYWVEKSKRETFRWEDFILQFGLLVIAFVFVFSFL